MRERELVIARYREDLDWVSDLQNWHIHVYDKSGTPEFNARLELCHPIKVTRLPNIGREAHTYLHHIIEHYHDLAEFTVFLQGNPHDHVDNLVQQLEDLPADLGFFDLGHTPVAEDCWGNPSEPGLDTAGCFSQLFSSKAPEFYLFHAGANFAVSRKTIRRRPREFYQGALQAVLASKHGPWEIERIWPLIFPSMTGRQGIVTAATPDIFFDLQLMLQSLDSFEHCPVEVFDLGLTDPQKEWIEHHPQRHLRVLPRLVNRISRLRRTRDWPTWLKPFYLSHSRFDRLLWIDADCIVLRNPFHAFQLIQSQPLIMKDVSPTIVRNHSSLYHHLPVLRVNPSLRVNAGVVGLDRHRDAELLAAWCWSVQWAARNLRLCNRFRWFDQGALLWTLQRLKQDSVVCPDLSWNTPWLVRRNVAEQAAVQGLSLQQLLKREFPDTGIVHFLGHSKLSQQCQELLTGNLGKTGTLVKSPNSIECNHS